jgi:hypothetical protein
VLFIAILRAGKVHPDEIVKILIGIALLSFVIWVLYLFSRDAAEKESKKKQTFVDAFQLCLGSIPGFASTHNLSYEGPPGLSQYGQALSQCLRGGLHFDNINRKICVLKRPERCDAANLKPIIFEQEKLVRVDVTTESGDLVARSQPDNTVGRAILGGVLFGSTGAIVGALSSPTTTVTSRGTGAKLCLYFDDIQNSYFEVWYGTLSDANNSYAKLLALIKESRPETSHKAASLPD